MSEPPEPPQPPELPQAPQPSSCEPAPEPRRFLGRWALLGGIGVGTLVYVIAIPLSLLAGNTYSVVSFWLAIQIGVTVAVIVAGTSLVANERTRLFGAGVFISLAVGLIVGNGVCYALITASRP